MTTPRASLGSRRLRLLLLAILLVVIAVTIWYVFLRSGGPPPVGPGAPVIPGLASPAA